MHRSRSAVLLPVWSVLIVATTIFAMLGWNLHPFEASAVGGMLALVGLVDFRLARSED